MKHEINQVIAGWSEQSLWELLIYLKQIDESAPNNSRRQAFIKKIFEEDRTLLTRLAEEEHEANVRAAMHYVVEKNAELYRRLAKVPELNNFPG